MVTKRFLLSSVMVLMALTSSFSANKTFFEREEFERAQAQGKRILVEVTAPWCPTCKAQAPIIQKYVNQPENNNLAIFMVDFDTQKDELKYLNARSQSTLISYKGKVETARSAGDTTDAGIGKLIKSSQ